MLPSRGVFNIPSGYGRVFDERKLVKNEIIYITSVSCNSSRTIAKQVPAIIRSATPAGKVIALDIVCRDDELGLSCIQSVGDRIKPLKPFIAWDVSIFSLKTRYWKANRMNKMVR